MLRAGSLSTLLLIQRPDTATDEIGQPIPGWVDVASVWGDVRNLSGSESIRAGAVTSAVNTSIRVRWITGIDAGMRIIAGGVTYQIKAVMPDMQRREYVDFVAEVVS